MAARQPILPPGYIFPKEVSRKTGINITTLSKYRSGQPGRPPRGPAFTRLFGRVVYRESDVEAWLASQLERNRIVPGERNRRRRAA